MKPSNSKIPPSRVAEFLRVIAAFTTVEMDEGLFERLHHYVSGQLAGIPQRERDPALTRLLDSDPHLAELYALLYELEEAVVQDNLPGVESIPRPDLSFLSPDRRPTMAALLAGRIRRAGEAITLRMSEELLNLLRPGPQLAAGLRQAGGGRYGELLYFLDGPNQADSLPFRVSVFADREQPEFCLLEIEVIDPERAWPELAGSLVRLEVGETARETATDSWGTAVFEHIPQEALSGIRVTLNPHS